MSCTIFYKGTLKECHDPSDVLNIVSNHLQRINSKLLQFGNPIVICLHGRSEPLVFDFKKKTMDGFCKWNGKDPEQFYRIFDLFIELKPLFETLEIEDDGGLWYEYIARKNACKITLRELQSEEKSVLDRMKENELDSPNEIEQYIIAQSGLEPFNPSILRIIVQDFIRIMKIDSIDDFRAQSIVDFANELEFANDHCEEEQVRLFNFTFQYMLMKIWISYVFSYKGIDRVKALAEEIKGLRTSKLAALYDGMSIFLNSHSGGAVNAKGAEMRKFANQYCRTGAFGDTATVGGLEYDLQLFFSIMDYLGFKYVGVE